ncbi:MAG: hypothetical protein WCI11_02935 [Candidatus Methylumidiphilus sp.]
MGGVNAESLGRTEHKGQPAQGYTFPLAALAAKNGLVIALRLGRDCKSRPASAVTFVVSLLSLSKGEP